MKNLAADSLQFLTCDCVWNFFYLKTNEQFQNIISTNDAFKFQGITHNTVGQIAK